MNEILFLIGDWPVRVADGLIGISALALVLLLVLVMVVAKSGRRGAELAMAQAIRAQHNEEAKAAEDIGRDGFRGSSISAEAKDEAREEAQKARREDCQGEEISDIFARFLSQYK